MKTSIHLFLTLVSIFCFGQKDNNWYVFYNSDSTRIGFKDSRGQTKIEPKFEPFMMNSTFKNIIAVKESSSGYKADFYYVNKNGRKFGKDSVYVFDFEYASESDNKIKFKDYKKHKVGFFDENGKVLIPAIYNDAGNFHNGIAKVLKNANRWCYDNNSEMINNCEHYGWKDGVSIMINEKNQELFEIPKQQDYSFAIDYSQFKVNEKVDPEIYTSYQAYDGNVYSFYSPEKHFNKWFETIFLPDFKKNKSVLPKYFYGLISVSDNDDPKFRTAWKNHKKTDYLKRKQKSIDEVFNQLINGIYQKSISWETLSNHLYFPENELPKEDLRKNTVISFMARAESDYSSTNSFQFTKIGDLFFITSAL